MLKNRKFLLLLAPPLFVLGLVIAAAFSGMVKSSVVTTSSAKSASAQDSENTIPLVIQPAEASFAPMPTPEPTLTPVAPQAPTQSHTVSTPAPKPTPKPVVKTSTATVQPAPKPATCGGSYTEQFICLLNRYRASKGLGKVSYSSSLAGVALTHSKWMNTTGTFAHVEADGSHFFDRCGAAGIVCRAENLALGAGSADNLLTMWKNSAGHNANLLGPYSTIGLGIAGSYVTALFN